MIYKCEFCSTEFRDKYTFNKHLSSAKYCLMRRQNSLQVENYRCGCSKIFINEKSYHKHISICTVYAIKQENIALKEENKAAKESALKLREEFDTENKKMKEIILQLREEISYFKGRKDEGDVHNTRVMDTLEKAALKKTTTTNNNQYNLFPIDMSTKRFDEQAKYLTGSVISEGQVGLANFIVDRIATNDKGELGIICTNYKTGMFKYMDENGNMIPDIGAKKIAKSFENSEECSLKINKSLERLWMEYKTEEDAIDKEDLFKKYMEIKREMNAFVVHL